MLSDISPVKWRKISGWRHSPLLSCFVLTAVISLATKQTKTDEELKGLVYSLTPKVKDDEQNWFMRPAVLGVILLAACVVLNIIFW